MSTLPFASLRRCLVLALSCAAAGALATESDREAAARALLDDVFGITTAVEHRFTDAMRDALPPGKLAELAPALQAQVGTLNERDPMRHGCLGDHATIWQTLHFEHGQLNAKITFDGDERIAGLFFAAPEVAQPCESAEATDETANETTTSPDLPDGVREQTLTTGAAGWPLPGILTLPTGQPARAAVVLVHGSGPHDADETIFGNKPFRDLAHGLAQRGIASLRYVKRTKEYAARLLDEHPDLTVEEETIQDAVAAVAQLRERSDLPADHIYVLGHSLGALLAPRIGQSSPETAGLILLAGSAQPVEDSVMAQVHHLAASQGISQEQIDEFQAQADRVKALARGEEIDGPLLLGLNAAYWRDLAGYDPVTTAKTLTRPILILHGERDYQVTLTDLQRWRDELGQRPSVTIHAYPALNHLFMPGEGPSLPAEYMQAGRVDEQVIDDIAAWLKTQAGVSP